MAIYQGADTMEASEAQSIWDVIQGKKRHGKKTLEQHGKRKLFGGVSDILEIFLPEGVKQVVDIGSKQLEQKLFKMPEYEEEDGSFWASSEIADFKEQDEAFRKGADETLLESIIGNIGDYVGVGTDKPNPFKGFLDEGNRGGDVAEVGGYKEIDNYSPFDIFKGGDWREQLSSFLDTGTRTSYKEQGGRVPKYKNGGQVPQYYGGGSVSGNPTIAGYFSQQGKTLGGSNTQSLAEKLGRK